MKKNIKWIALFAVIAVGVFAVGYKVGVGAATDQPGSAGDPVITKSYLDSKIAEFNSANVYQQITLGTGSTLTAPSGTTFVVTSGAGKATAAISDISAGSNLASGKAITKHHSYLIRTNSTGITATSDCKVYIIGNYEIN